VREALALTRAAWLHTLSYRLQTFFTIFGVIVSIVPVYYVSRAVQPIMADSIRLEGGQYFGFLVVGIVTYMLIAVSVNGFHGAISGEISTGAFEAILATPVRIPAILAGEIGQGMSWAICRALVLLVTAGLFGAHILWTRALLAACIAVLIVATYIPIGIIAGALVVAFRTTGPFPSLVLGVSAMLGGLYYPTSVIPSWLANVSTVVPLTYGLRAMRQCLIGGAPIANLASDLLVLTAFGVVLWVVAVVSFDMALRHGRRAGTLAQY
jgi:ABC-2 type transport system permease protein